MKLPLVSANKCFYFRCFLLEQSSLNLNCLDSSNDVDIIEIPSTSLNYLIVKVTSLDFNSISRHKIYLTIHVKVCLLQTCFVIFFNSYSTGVRQCKRCCGCCYLNTPIQKPCHFCWHGWLHSNRTGSSCIWRNKKEV